MRGLHRVCRVCTLLSPACAETGCSAQVRVPAQLRSLAACLNSASCRSQTTTTPRASAVAAPAGSQEDTLQRDFPGARPAKEALWKLDGALRQHGFTPDNTIGEPQQAALAGRQKCRD